MNRRNVNWRNWRIVLRAGIAIAIVTGLLFLLITPSHHSATLSGVLFFPLLFADIVQIPAVLGRLKEADPLVPNPVLISFRRFQRPPPLALA